MTGPAMLVPSQRQYSADLIAKIESAKRLTYWLLETQPPRTKATDRNRIAGALFNITLEHHVAMVFLLSNRMASPSFALARSVWEAYVRGLWARDIVNDSELGEFIAGRNDPTMNGIMKAIRKHSKIDNENKIGMLHDDAWKTLNSYAHGGSLQVQRWITTESVEASHSEEEIADLLRFANHVAYRACVALVELAEASQLEGAVIQKGNELASGDWF